MNTAKLEYDLAHAKQQIISLTAELAATKAALEKAQLALRDSREAAKRYISKWACYAPGTIGSIHMSEFLGIAERGLGGKNV